MKRRIRLSEVVCGKGVAFAVSLMALLVIGGCSESVPTCDGDKTVKAVVNHVSDEMRKDLSAISSMGTGMGLSDDEWRAIRIGIIIELESIREHSLDETAGKRNCAANLMIVHGGAKELVPVTYVTGRDKDNGEVQISLSGFREPKAFGPEETESED